MSAPRRASDIRRLSGIVDARRVRSPQGALLEMAMLEMERQRLLAESLRALRRCEAIALRVAGIDRLQQGLRRVVDRHAQAPEAGSPSPSRQKLPPVVSRRFDY